ncbi:MAG TPA: HDOD domain-containing protein, partial [Solirubrobacterales bacterium]|nr:HDOD domain-containing protein [Solirubrobacterales bacterium]
MPTKPHSNGKVRKADAQPSRAGAPAPGARLAAAFEAVEKFPALIESRARVMRAATAETSQIGELVEAVEADVALTISVLRFANRASSSGSIGGIPAAIETLKPSGILAIAGTSPVFDFFEPNGGWEMRPEQVRVHALATQQAAEKIGRAIGWTERDELVVA